MQSVFIPYSLGVLFGFSRLLILGIYKHKLIIRSLLFLLFLLASCLFFFLFPLRGVSVRRSPCPRRASRGRWCRRWLWLLMSTTSGGLGDCPCRRPWSRHRPRPCRTGYSGVSSSRGGCCRSSGNRSRRRCCPPGCQPLLYPLWHRPERLRPWRRPVWRWTPTPLSTAPCLHTLSWTFPNSDSIIPPPRGSLKNLRL